MILIIGGATKNYGIIVGDSQMTTKGLEKRIKHRRSIKNKLYKESNKFAFGILGKWGKLIHAKDEVSYLDDHHTLKKLLHKLTPEQKKNKLESFVRSKMVSDGTAIYLFENEDGYSVESISQQEQGEERIKRIDHGEKKLVFNEPFAVSNDEIEQRINDCHQKYHLTDSLSDTIFLLNNVILDVISQGEKITLSANGVSYLDQENTVGGYVTFELLLKESNRRNSFALSYYGDEHVLLDKTTNPYGKFVDRNRQIRYVDNLSMLVKAFALQGNMDSHINDQLMLAIEKQINLIVSEDILSPQVLNILINKINSKYHLKLDRLQEEAIDIIEATIEAIVQDENPPDASYLLRFF